MWLYFVLLGVNAFAAILIISESASELTVEFVGTIAFTVVVLGWVLAVPGRVTPGLVRTGPAAWYPISAALGALTFAVASVTIGFLVAEFGMEELSYSDSFLNGGYGWGMVILMICVQPAVIEELAFRGVVLDALGGLLGSRDAVIVSALMFMVLHVMVLSFLHLFLMGLALGYLRLRTKSLYPCMIAHFTHNLLCILPEMGGL